jgi:hypothetical protein
MIAFDITPFKQRRRHARGDAVEVMVVAARALMPKR